MVKRATIGALAGIAIAALVLAVPASSMKREKHSVGVSLIGLQEGDQFVFVNQVLAQGKKARRRCVAKRRFVLKRRRAGKDEVIHRGKTDRNGASRAAIPRDQAGGVYYEVLAKKKRKRGQVRYVCRRAVSNEVKVE